MNKLCCCLDQPEAPSINFNVNCPSSCCESRLHRSQADVIDFNAHEVVEPKNDNDNDDKEDTVCCFIRKRHAKLKNSKAKPKHGEQT